MWCVFMWNTKRSKASMWWIGVRMRSSAWKLRKIWRQRCRAVCVYLKCKNVSCVKKKGANHLLRDNVCEYPIMSNSNCMQLHFHFISTQNENRHFWERCRAKMKKRKFQVRESRWFPLHRNLGLLTQFSSALSIQCYSMQCCFTCLFIEIIHHVTVLCWKCACHK